MQRGAKGFEQREASEVGRLLRVRVRVGVGVGVGVGVRFGIGVRVRVRVRARGRVGTHLLWAEGWPAVLGGVGLQVT